MTKGVLDFGNAFVFYISNFYKIVRSAGRREAVKFVKRWRTRPYVEQANELRQSITVLITILDVRSCILRQYSTANQYQSYR